MRTVITTLRQLSASLRMLIAFTVLFGIAYPFVVLAVSQLPGLQHRADGSLIHRNGRVVGSALIGQSFTDAKGAPLPQYLQSRPSDAGAGYDPTATAASNLGPESVVDTLPNPKDSTDSGKQSLLTQVCSRSLAIGKEYGVSGARPFCTPDGVGAVLAVFYSGPGYAGHVVRAVSVNQECPDVPFVRSYRGVHVQCAQYGADYAKGRIVPIRGDAPAHPAVPADAVTASGSGLDPEISTAYARLQESVIAAARHVRVAQVAAVVRKYTTGRDLGFMGEAKVNVLKVDLALDRLYPMPR